MSKIDDNKELEELLDPAVVVEPNKKKNKNALIRELKGRLRDVIDELEVQCMHIRNDLRKEAVDKNKIISRVVAIEAAIS